VVTTSAVELVESTPPWNRVMHHDRRDPEAPERSGASDERIRHETRWVDLQIREAMESGEFDDLPRFGKPIEDLGSQHDPEWWAREVGRARADQSVATHRGVIKGFVLSVPLPDRPRCRHW
jgi:hypothetical protein